MVKLYTHLVIMALAFGVVMLWPGGSREPIGNATSAGASVVITEPVHYFYNLNMGGIIDDTSDNYEL